MHFILAEPAQNSFHEPRRLIKAVLAVWFANDLRRSGVRERDRDVSPPNRYTVMPAGMIVLKGRVIARHRWPMDEKQNTELARTLDQIIGLLRSILIALAAILGLLWFRH